MPDAVVASPVVPTATGDVPASDLGFVLPHEHLVWAEAGWQHDTVAVPPHAERVATAVAMLERAAATGVATVVDPTPPEMGRDVALMAEASQRSGVRVVFATGLYARWPTPYFTHCSVDDLADWFGTELTDGVGPTGARPAFVKVAVETPAMSAHERTVLHAAALTHHQHDTPILVHCQPGAALPVLALLVDELGVAGDAVVIGHAESDPDLTHHLTVVETYGAYLGFDRFGLSAFGVTDDLRVATVAGLCALGHAGRLHLAHDCAAQNLGRGARMLAERTAALPRWRVDRVGDVIVPRLRAAGLDEPTVRAMTHDAPASWLTRGRVPTAPGGPS